jgi:hypothetical protein
MLDSLTFKPVPDVSLSLFTNGTFLREELTDGNGTFKFLNLPYPSLMSLQTYKGGYHNLSKTLTSTIQTTYITRLLSVNELAVTFSGGNGSLSVEF